MELFFLLVIILYIFMLLVMKLSWDKHRLNLLHLQKELPTALIIPFRNESRNLPPLLLNLEDVIPPSVEVIFIDDESEDNSYAIIESFLQKKSHTKWLLISSKGRGKKAAISTGISSTLAEIIVTTDADCELPEHWLSWLCQAFYLDHIKLVAGPVLTKSCKGLYKKFQQIEWASILLLSQFLFSKGQVFICSGANLAYRRSAFEEVSGYSGNEEHLSGDDEFLLKKIILHFGAGSAVFIKEKGALVKTIPLSGLSAFVQQRVRWGSKWKMHGFSIKSYSAILSVGLAITQIGSIIMVFGDFWSNSAFAAFWFIKISGERIVLGRVLEEYKVFPNFLSYIITSLVHPLYILFIAFLAAFGKFSWKGRKQ